MSKTIEQMAHEYVRGNECCVMDDYRSHEESFIAGAKAQLSLSRSMVLDFQNRYAGTLEEIKSLTEKLEIAKGAFNKFGDHHKECSIELVSKWCHCGFQECRDELEKEN